MNKLQQVELNIVKSITDILKKHDIKYYILGGTLLGAVRHKGFIPWDDDIDIGIFRDEYEKALDILRSELSGSLKLNYYKDNYHNEDYISYYMAKVEDSNIKVVNKTAEEEQIMNAWVDIFPIDALPNSKVKSFFHKFHLLILRAQLRYSQYSKLVTKNSKNKDLFMRFMIFIGKVFRLQKIYKKDKVLDKIDKSLKKYSINDCKNIINFAGACKSYKFIEIFPKKVYDELVEYEFEDTKLIGPKDYDFILTKQYGDYMKLPPIDSRNKHNTEIIE